MKNFLSTTRERLSYAAENIRDFAGSIGRSVSSLFVAPTLVQIKGRTEYLLTEIAKAAELRNKRAEDCERMVAYLNETITLLDDEIAQLDQLTVLIEQASDVLDV